MRFFWFFFSLSSPQVWKMNLPASVSWRKKKKKSRGMCKTPGNSAFRKLKWFCLYPFSTQLWFPGVFPDCCSLFCCFKEIFWVFSQFLAAPTSLCVDVTLSCCSWRDLKILIKILIEMMIKTLITIPSFLFIPRVVSWVTSAFCLDTPTCRKWSFPAIKLTVWSK